MQRREVSVLRLYIRHGDGVDDADRQYKNPTYHISRYTIVDIWNAANDVNTNKSIVRVTVTDSIISKDTTLAESMPNGLCLFVGDARPYDKNPPHDISIPVKRLYTVGNNIIADSILIMSYIVIFAHFCLTVDNSTDL